MKCNVRLINEKINNAIEKYEMLKESSTVVIGVSGGADSMTLLKFFIDYSREKNIKIIAAHVNHCLRGNEADRDENFVREYCNKNNVNFECLRIDIKKQAQILGEGIEECARKVRYSFFYELSDKYNAIIATAHTLSDSVETAFINLSRGTGPIGLCGIPAKRGNIIRPLIFLKRAETQVYCDENNISYVVDSTNLKREYTRNKIRLDIVPIMKQINSEFEDNVLRTMNLLKSDEDYLCKVSNQILEKNRISYGEYLLDNISNQHFSILSRCIRMAIFNFTKSNITLNHVKIIIDIIKNGSGAVILPHGVKVDIKNNTLKVSKIKEEKQSDYFETPFNEGKILTENGEEVIIKILNKEDFEKFKKVNNLLFFYALDYDTITVETSFRNRRSGDIFCQCGRGVTKTVKKLFNELKIPCEKREKILMLANENEILWINNIGISQKAKVTEHTKKIVLIYSKEK